MHGVGARVSPMAVEAMLGESCAQPPSSMSLEATGAPPRSRRSWPRRQRPRRPRPSRPKDRPAAIDESAGPLEQRARCVDPDLEFAGSGDRIGIFAGVVDAGVLPGPRGGAHEARPCPRAPPRRCPASIAACMIWANGPIEVGRSNNALNERTEKGWTSTSSRTVVPEPVTRCPKPDQSSTIVIALGLARHEGDRADVVVVIGDDRDPMGEEHAGRIEFAAVQAKVGPSRVKRVAWSCAVLVPISESALPMRSPASTRS